MHSTIEQQVKHNDCGISVVKILFNIYNLQISRNYIEENIHLDEKGSSLQDIKVFLDNHQFGSSFHLLDLNTLKFNSEKLNALVPCILPVKDTRGQHYVVVRKFSGKKIEILDPAIGASQKWTFSELVQHAYISTGNYNLVDNSAVLEKIISEELNSYNLDPIKIQYTDPAEVINKLTYFTYVKENFGFAGKEAEANFLQDLLLNQEINILPKQFRTLRTRNGVLRIKAPVVLTARPSSNAPIPDSNSSIQKPQNPYKRLFIELRQYHKLWGIFIFSAIFSALIAQVTVFSNQILIDNVLPSFNINVLILFAIGLGIFKIFDLVLSLYKSFISVHLSNIIDNYFLSSFIEKINSFSIRYIHSFSRGDLSERIKDSLKLKTFFIKFFTRIIIDCFVTLYSLAVLFLINWKISLIVIIVLGIFLVWFKVITPYIRQNEKRRFLEKSNLFSALFENIDGLQVIKLFRLEQVFQQRLAPKVKNILQIQKKVKYVSLINSAVINLLIIIASLLIIVLLSREAINTQGISVGQIITFLALTYRIFSSVSSILDENLDILENEIILTRYFDFGAGQDGSKSQPLHNKMKLPSIQKVEFRDISFYYIPEKPILKSLNISIEKGDKIKLEGNNGTGKSTFCKVLALLYPPESGEILINNEKQSYFNQSSIRKRILLVSNEDPLFNDTIGYNISFRYDTNTAEVLNLAREIGLYEFISSNDEGLDFVINEQGRNLSTGQRKKILIMRALLSDAEVIILDETLSGIDKESKSMIEQFINTDTSRAFIIISHEPMNQIHFSKILTMKNGNIEQLQYERV